MVTNKRTQYSFVGLVINLIPSELSILTMDYFFRRLIVVDLHNIELLIWGKLYYTI